MTLEHPNSQDPEIIAEDLENRRSELNDTISQITDQLNPSAFMQDISQDLAYYGTKTGQFTLDFIRRNPTASLLTLAGITWAVINESRSNSNRWYNSNQRHENFTNSEPDEYLDPYLSSQSAISSGEDFTKQSARTQTPHLSANLNVTGSNQVSRSTQGKNTIHSRQESGDNEMNLKNKTAHAASDLKESTLHKGQEIAEWGRETKDQITQKGREVSKKSTEFFHRNPLAVGAFGVIAGIALGSLIPSSRAEDRLMGKTKDRTLDRLASSGEHLLQKAKEAGKEAMEEMKHEVGSEIDKQIPDDIKDKSQSNRENRTSSTLASKHI